MCQLSERFKLLARIISKGAFNNYVERILSFFDPPPPCVNSFYTLSVDKNRHFLTPSPRHLVHVIIECPLRNFKFQMELFKGKILLRFMIFANTIGLLIRHQGSQEDFNLKDQRKFLKTKSKAK